MKLEQSDSDEEYELILDGPNGESTPTKRIPRKPRDRQSWYYLGLMGEVGFTIALPIVGGALVGTYLDRIWSSYPKATLSFLFIGIVISVIGFVQTIRDIVKRSSTSK